MPTGIYASLLTDCRCCGKKMRVARGAPRPARCSARIAGARIWDGQGVYDREKGIGNKAALPPWVLAREGEPVRGR